MHETAILNLFLFQQGKLKREKRATASAVNLKFKNAIVICCKPLLIRYSQHTTHKLISGRKEMSKKAISFYMCAIFLFHGDVSIHICLSIASFESHINDALLTTQSLMNEYCINESKKTVVQCSYKTYT